MRNPVGISMKKNEIVIRISEKATHEETIECLNKKLPALKKLYKAEKTPILVSGKVLKNREMDEVKEIITSQIDVKVKFDSPKTLGLSGIKEAFEREIENSDTKFYKGNLRSGKKVEHEGSIVILGDVNGGAEVVAGENIVILGVLRGLAHAGAKGNKKAFIATNRIECPQLRISNIVKEMDKEEIDEEFKYAYINEKDEMILE